MYFVLKAATSILRPGRDLGCMPTSIFFFLNSINRSAKAQYFCLQKHVLPMNSWKIMQKSQLFS